MFNTLEAYKFNKFNLKLFITLFIFTSFYIFRNTGERYDILVLSIFFFIAVFSLYGTLISIDTKSFSLNKTFCLFFYFFFSLAPVVQYKNNVVFFVDYYLTREIYIKTGVILLLILILYLVFYHIIFKYLMNHHFLKDQLKLNFKVNRGATIYGSYVLVLFSLIAVIYLMKWDLSLLVYRPFTYVLKDHTNLGLVGYALLLIFRLIPFIILLKYKIENDKNDRHTYFYLLVLFIICFPLSLSRGILAIIYIPIFILFLPQLRKGINYVLLFMVGLLVIFPLFNNFRYLKEGNFEYNFELFNTGHFDAFQNFALLINENVVTNGRQLLGSVLFFVQESHWPNRPHGSGYLLGETIGYSYLNVSMPFFGEGFVNWGYTGILLFLILIVLLNSIWDFTATKGFNSFPLKSFYLIFLGFEFYLLRGDLYSAIKILSSFLLALIVVRFFFFLNSKTKKKFFYKK